MRKIDSLLSNALGREEVLRTARAQAALRQWPDVVGEGLAARSWPDRYDRGTVWVAVSGSAWAQELRMIKPKILRRLQELSGERGLFEDVRFGVRPFAPLPPVPEPPPEEEPRDLSELSIQEIAEERLKAWPRARRA